MPGMRRFLAAGMCVSLVVASVAAPLTHVHEDDHETDHHSAYGVHAHFSGHHAQPAQAHDPRRAEIDANENERVVYLQLFVAVAGSSLEMPAAVVTSTSLAAPEESPAHRSVHIMHGHDPPVFGPRLSRAPPASPVLI
jgi:hypothetical protein